MGNPASPNFQKTMVRGHYFDFSISIINQYKECIDFPKEEEEFPNIDLMVSVILTMFEILDRTILSHENMLGHLYEQQ